jgi:hypothetical protein
MSNELIEVEVPIRARQVELDGSQFVEVDWIEPHSGSLALELLDDSGGDEPVFVESEMTLTVRRTEEGHLVADLVDESSKETWTIPFTIQAPELWPSEWLDV